MFRSALKVGIKELLSNNKDYLWIKLDKVFFGLREDIYMCNVYIPPEKSDLHKTSNLDYFDTLQDDIAQYSSMGEIILVGDMNSRTSEVKEKYELMEEDIILCEKSSLNSSLNFEEIKNIVDNGRIIGDLDGKITYICPTGVSTIDYCITSIRLYKDINRFTVCEPQWYSDHNPISFSSRVNKANVDVTHHV